MVQRIWFYLSANINVTAGALMRGRGDILPLVTSLKGFRGFGRALRVKSRKRISFMLGKVKCYSLEL